MPLISRKEMLKQMDDPQPFSVKYRTKGGELNIAENVICTSINHKHKTINLKHLDSEQIRSVRHILIVEFKGQEVYL